MLSRNAGRAAVRFISSYTLPLIKPHHHPVGPTGFPRRRNLSTSPRLSSQVEQHLVSRFPYLPSSRLGHPLDHREAFEEDREYSSLVSPAVQVFSVSVHTDFEDETEGRSEIHGSIRAIEGQGRTFCLYNRDRTDPETILKHGNLSLISSELEDSIISCSIDDTTHLELCLNDRARDIEVIKGQYILHSKSDEIEESCNKLMKGFVQGEHGFALVYYIIFQFAAVATLTVDIFSKSDSNRPLSDIHGSIFAGYANAEQYCRDKDEIEHMKSPLFMKPSGHFGKATDGSSIRLSRCIVAVPAYSSLIVEAHLWDSQGIFAHGSAKFSAHGQGYFTKLIVSERGVVSVSMSLGDTFTRLHKGEALRLSSPDAERGAPVLDDVQQVTKEFSPFGYAENWPVRSPVRGTDLVEVFSLYVAGITSEVSVLCGRILFQNWCHGLSIYERNLSNPEILSADKCIASIEGHRLLYNTSFSIKLCLKDPVWDLEVCNGKISWDPYALNIRNLNNKRLCSVVRGEHSYVAVHYIVLGCACRANVEISFFFANHAHPASVYGCVFARYGNHSYSTAYERKYFRGRLFDKSQADSIQLQKPSKLPLSKSVVAVPIDTSLIIEADLRASSVGNTDDEALCGMTTFEIDLSETSQKIQGVHYGIEVSVKFDDRYNYRF